jgi:hypothetical protein
MARLVRAIRNGTVLRQMARTSTAMTGKGERRVSMLKRAGIIWSKTARYRLARTSRIRIRISAQGGGFCSPASSSSRALQHAHFLSRGMRSTESKGFNTEKQARVTESTEQERIWALRAVCGRAPTRSVIILTSVDSVVLACFSVLESLLSWIRPRSGRTPMSLAPGRRPRAKEKLSDAEPSQTSRCEPGDP